MQFSSYKYISFKHLYSFKAHMIKIQNYWKQEKMEDKILIN